MRAVVLFVALALACGGCGAMLRANAGPTVTLDGRFGVEVGGEAATHLLGTEIVGAPIGVRVQGSAVGSELAGFIALVLGDSAMPGFYGVAPSDKDTAGYSGHLSGALGVTTDGAIGVRSAAAVGRGRGHAIDGDRVQYVERGFEAAVQSDFTVHDHDWTNTANRITASMYWQWTRLPVNHWSLPELGPTKH